MVAADKVDIVIVGAGAAGSVFAATLAEAGRSVLVLEGGKARTLDDLYSSQIWARRLKWGAPTVEETGPHPVWYNFNAGHGTGGAGIHHYAVWPRYHPEDMRSRSLYGRALDWPFDYDVLRPYYDEVQEDVGISGDAEAERWRPPGAPYPLPPILVNEHGRAFAKGFDALGLHTSPIPMAVLSRPYKGRPACIWDGWCDAGCPTGALANPLAVYLPRARAAGARLQADSRVSRVLMSPKGDRAVGVEYYDADGVAHVQLAEAVVLAAFTVENPRILLNSATDGIPGGVANSSGLVGKYLLSHAAVMVYGMFPQQTNSFFGTTGGQLFNQDAFDKHSDAGAYGSRQWEIGLALKPNDLLGIAMSRPDIYGEALHQFMRDGVRHLGAMVAVCEDQPNVENRVELSSKKDRFGLPIARTVYRYSDDALKLWEIAGKEGVAITQAAGAKEAWHGPLGGQHIMGGTIMGLDPVRSVVNRYSQAHDVPNLFIGGGGVFPTSSCVNSTFTIHATSLMAAHYLRDHWSGIAA
ncbi:MAG TPA: GMC family oxidoreductase [Gammaproteobacteria bacterium]|nr:GMC family oxidoreductase [Gammaproteobacteria bacterium]